MSMPQESVTMSENRHSPFKNTMRIISVLFEIKWHSSYVMAYLALIVSIYKQF